VPCSTATRVCASIAAHIETRAGDRDLAAASLDHERARGVVLNAEHRFAFTQFDQSSILLKTHLQTAAAVQINH
jgi:hypothetical protein